MTVVLVHGAYHGAWAWDGVVAALAERGIGSEAVELPFTGFADDVAVAREAIVRAGGDAVVCGHSYGGSVISAAARGLEVAHLVYLCAFMVDEEEPTIPLWFTRPVALHTAMAEVDGRFQIDLSKAAECFYGDADATVVDSILPRLRSIPGTAGDPIDESAPAWRDTPSTYVVCNRDQAIHPDVQRIMARHATNVVEWDTDHSPFVTRPADVADLLAGIAEGRTAAD